MARTPAKKANRKSPRRLMLGETAAVPRSYGIPTFWLNTLIGIYLLVPAWLLTKTFFLAFSRATLHQEFWATDEFWFFGLGTILWTLWFCGSIWSLGEPRPLRAYVFGHELTHAVWVWLFGGTVSQFEVSRSGGSILTDTNNVWVALAPYFYPIYSFVIIVAYGAASVFYDVAGSRITLLWMTPLQWMFLGLGVTWAFHMTFTCWMIPKGQSDLTSHGTFFSLVFIYVINVALLAVLLIIAAPEITWVSFARELLENTENFASGFVSAVERFVLCTESL